MFWYFSIGNLVEMSVCVIYNHCVMFLRPTPFFFARRTSSQKHGSYGGVAQVVGPFKFRIVDLLRDGVIQSTCLPSDVFVSLSFSSFRLLSLSSPLVTSFVVLVPKLNSLYPFFFVCVCVWYLSDN